MDETLTDYSALFSQAIQSPMPGQTFKPVLSAEEVKQGLAKLSPDVPWCHYFELGDAGCTVDESADRYYQKAKSLKILGSQILESIPYVTRRGRCEGLTVLDLASAEGQHSIELAMAGAGRVLGIEGRKLYVERSNFIARCFGAGNASFQQGDVRQLSVDQIGTFELVLFFGILHHLGPDDFLPMLRTLRQLTSDSVVIFAHTAENGADVRFGGRLSEVQINADGFSGRLYREHPDGMAAEERERRVRSSLDNTFSFWPKEAELLRGLKVAGFQHVSRQLMPNPFNDPTGEFRVVYLCRV